MARAGTWSTCPLIGMDRELRRLAMMLSGANDSIVLVGDPGVGKSSVIYGLSWHLANGSQPLIPQDLASTTIVAIQPTDLLAGTGGRGKLESRLNDMLDFFRSNKHVVPFFDEVHTLFDAKDPTMQIVATAVKPAMATGQFRCIGATTDHEYARYIAGDEALSSRFTRLLIAEPDESATVEILGRSIANILSPQARGLSLKIPTSTIEAAVRVSTRYQRSDCQPRKSIKLLKAAVAEKTYALMVSADVSKDPTLSERDIVGTFSDMSGIPAYELAEDRSPYFAQLRGRLNERVVGQTGAVNTIVEWLRVQANGWLQADKPRGRFLFVGPSGVGKSELARAIADEVIRDRGSVISRNMAEYAGEASRSRFMGSDPGYKGFGETATVYSEVLMRPYSVVIFEDINRAHPSVVEPLLSILDGRGEDAQGRTVDFSQCIFVLTAASDQAIQNGVATQRPNDDHRSHDSSDDSIRRSLLASGGDWSPALLERIDRICEFKPLDRNGLLAVLERALSKRKARAAVPLPVEVDDEAIRNQIVDMAIEGQKSSSAGRIERALTLFLARFAGPARISATKDS
jgi:ATP-dependent Clp protease ATP-binding subunit ClpA